MSAKANLPGIRNFLASLVTLRGFSLEMWEESFSARHYMHDILPRGMKLISNRKTTLLSNDTNECIPYGNN